MFDGPSIEHLLPSLLLDFSLVRVIEAPLFWEDSGGGLRVSIHLGLLVNLPDIVYSQGSKGTSSALASPSFYSA